MKMGSPSFFFIAGNESTYMDVFTKQFKGIQIIKEDEGEQVKDGKVKMWGLLIKG